MMVDLAHRTARLQQQTSVQVVWSLSVFMTVHSLVNLLNICKNVDLFVVFLINGSVRCRTSDQDYTPPALRHIR